MKIFLLILTLVILGCNEPKKFHYDDIPDILENTIPSKSEDLFLNLNLQILPSNKKYILQIVGSDTINILEYDNKNRLIFKLYRQYVHETWNDFYITMIEGHIYDNDILTKTIFLHSNADFVEYNYSYKSNLLEKVLVYEKSFPSVNNNENWKIKYLTNFKQLHSFMDSFDIHNKENLTTELSRTYNENIVTEKRRNLKEKNTIVLNRMVFNEETKKLEYQTSPQTMFIYDENLILKSKIKTEYKDTNIIISKYYYSHDTIDVLEYIESIPFVKRKLVNNNIVYFKYIRNLDTSNYEENLYECDKYGLPCKTTIKNTYEKDSIINIKTIYK